MPYRVCRRHNLRCVLVGRGECPCPRRRTEVRPRFAHAAWRQSRRNWVGWGPRFLHTLSNRPCPHLGVHPFVVCIERITLNLSLRAASLGNSSVKCHPCRLRWESCQTARGIPWGHWVWDPPCRDGLGHPTTKSRSRTLLWRDCVPLRQMTTLATLRLEMAGMVAEVFKKLRRPMPAHVCALN